MTAPVAAFVELPDDSANAGKKVRTQTQVIGGNTVHAHMVVPTVGMTITGKYFFSSTQKAIVASAQNATSTGSFWLQMPAAATVTALIRTAILDYSIAGAVITLPTAPVISFSKFTYTGTASGASVTPVKYQTAGVANQMIVQTAVTGMTVTVVGDFAHSTIPAFYTLTSGAAQYGGSAIVLPKSPIAYERGTDLEIGPGEGVVIWQSTAGTTSDVRVFGIQLEWFELDLT